MNVIKLNLRQNAVHTLYHAVEHLYWSESDTDAKEGRSFNYDEHTVEWRNETGNVCFALSDFNRLPAVYNLKFAPPPSDPSRRTPAESICGTVRTGSGRGRRKS